jgi:hypothetical protein
MSAEGNMPARGQRHHGGNASNGWRWPRSVLMIVAAAGALMGAEDSEPLLPRPGAVLVADVIGEAIAMASEQEKVLKGEDRVRVGSTITTERMSLVTLLLSNGASLRIGSESELEIEEFGQGTIPDGLKFAELTEEPTVSRTRLRLLRGDVLIEVKPLDTSRGSSFMLSTVAGTVRSTEGRFHARVRMSDLGLGVFTIELERGAAEFEVIGGKFVPLQPGRLTAFALELDPATGLVKVTDMPQKAAKSAKTN